MRLWVESKMRPEAIARLKGSFDVVESDDLNQLEGVDGAIISAKPPADEAFMDRAGKTLKVIARPGIGVDNVRVEAATERGILVINTPDAPTESTAEHAVALLLALSKRVVAGDMLLRGAEVSRAALLGTEVRGRVLGVVGVGRIGRRVAEICGQGLRMRVLAYDPYVDRSQIALPGTAWVDDLEALLTQSDFVTLHTWLSLETRHLIGERELRRMKPGSYLINASRGPVVDETALIRVLQEGHLAGAGLDVFDPEPPVADNPLLRMVNVVATPHTGSFTDLGTQGMHDGVVDQFLQLRKGLRPQNLVNPEAWPGRMAGLVGG